MTPGLVSIILPVYNRPGPLVQAVDSALAQSWRPIEILIVDDGSTDETPGVAARLAAGHPGELRVLRRENGGPGVARETGRLAVRGELVQYLDSDDLLLPRKLELQVAALRARPECEIAYGICRETEPDGSERRPALRPSDRAIDTMFPAFLAERWWNTVTPLYRAELCSRAGPWSNLRLEEDWEYDARIAALRPRLAFVPEAIAVHRDLGGARLSRGATVDPTRLAWRAAAHLSLAESALREGSCGGSRELEHLGRELFQIARFCASAGLADWTQRLLSASVAVANGRPPLDLRLFRLATRIAGPRPAGRAAGLLDRVRGSRA